MKKMEKINGLSFFVFGLALAISAVPLQAMRGGKGCKQLHTGLRGPTGSVKLFCAAHDNNLAAVEAALAEKGVDPNYKGLFDGQTALHWARKHKNLEMVQKLLEAGANPLALDPNIWTPLQKKAYSNNGNGNSLRVVIPQRCLEKAKRALTRKRAHEDLQAAFDAVNAGITSEALEQEADDLERKAKRPRGEDELGRCTVTTSG